jgi:hypothetical protein
LAVLKNSATARRARSILLLMLPLTSKITPKEDRGILAGEVPNLLLFLVLVDREMFSLQASHDSAQRISDGHGNKNQGHFHPKGLATILQRRIDDTGWSSFLIRG